MTIEIEKQYRTRGGQEVRIYAVEERGLYPVHGAIKTGDGKWESHGWTVSGHWDDLVDEHHRDLIEVRPRIKREFWVNVYPGGIVNVRYSRNDADDDATSDRIACVRVEIDVEEGHGL